MSQPSDRSADEVRSISIPDVPAALFLRSQDHMNELLRELQIVAIGIDTGTVDDVPAEIVRTLGPILELYGAIRDTNRASAARELEAGSDTVTLEMELPVRAVADIRRAFEVLEQADRLCSSGQLLTLQSPPEIRDLRRRLAFECIRQLEEEGAVTPPPG